jgi:hypothetical protein
MAPSLLYYRAREATEESQNTRFFTPLRSVQNDTLNLELGTLNFEL